MAVSRKKKSVIERSLEKEEQFYSAHNQFLDDEEEDEKAPEDIVEGMHKGEKDEDVYSEEGLDEELEDDEISDWEQGFMEGELHSGRFAECYTCAKILDNIAEDIFIKEDDDEKHYYCSEECMEHSAP